MENPRSKRVLIFLLFFVPGIKCADKDCGERWECVSQNKCPDFQEEILKLRSLSRGTPEYENIIGNIRDRVCNRQERKICCPDHASYWLPTEEDYYHNKSTSGFIVGGEDTDLGEYPFMAAIGRKPQGCNGDIAWVCGGSLINHFYVLTAGHCHGPSENERITKVRLGEHEIGPAEDCFGGSCLPAPQDFDITEVIVHPNYFYDRANDNIENDIALIRLPTAAKIHWGVNFIILPKKNLIHFERKDSTVIGWGLDDGWDSQKYIDQCVGVRTQQKLDIPILNKKECEKESVIDLNLDFSKICAGGRKGEDSCRVKYSV